MIFSLIIHLHCLLFQLLMIFQNSNFILHYLLLSLEHVLLLLVATLLIQVQVGSSNKCFGLLLLCHPKLIIYAKQINMITKSAKYNYIGMSKLQDYLSFNSYNCSSRHQHQQGFSDQEKQPRIVISQNDQVYESSNYIKSKKTKIRYHEPKTKLKYIINDQSYQQNIQKRISDKEHQGRANVTKSLQIRKKESNRASNLFQPILKSKRTLVGQNLSIPTYAIHDFKVLKNNIVSQGHSIAFQAAKQINTHGYLKKIANNSFQKANFMQNKFNGLLKQRIKQSYILPKRCEQSPKNQTGLTFNSEIQNGNLDLVAKVTQYCYDLYLRIDTNTHGHQNWFHFEVVNNENQSKNFVFNICNMKREFKLIEKGQKIYVKQSAQDQKWQPAGTNITITQNSNDKIGRGRLYKLSFTLQLKPNVKYTVALIPSYTYSQMLAFLQQIQQSFKSVVQTELLSYSLTGLAIPIVTITNRQVKQMQKKVILVSCRIHPGESVASYVAQGIIRRLVDQTNKNISELLKTTIIKIIPMLNPDGVIFGNFRTNYLGVDLNRSFHHDDQVLYPQIWSLKNLGRQLKNKYQNSFILFIDLHGHSSQKNVFSYGPNYQYNDPNFFVAKLLPKILSMRSKYFKYNSCTFKLQQHKLNTARGFFLNELNVMTYTIESSYCLFDDLDGVTKIMRVDDWVNFGTELAEGLETSIRIKETNNSIRSNKQLKNIINANQAQQILIVKKIKSQIKKQLKLKNKEQIKQQSFVDSDGQSQNEDLNQQQRKETEKKVLQFSLPSFSLPRVLKPAILYPTITPKLFQVNQQKDESNFKILYTKRSKYNTLRMMNANSLYTNYLKNLDELEKFKPSAKNIKLQKKLQV